MSQPMSRETLQEYQRFLVAEGAVLHRRPSLLLQQAANRDDVPAIASVATAALGVGPNRRPWLKRLGNTVAGSCITTLLHSGPVSGCEWSPDGKTIASAGGDFSIQLWDAVTGRHLVTLAGHSSPFAFSPDSRFVVSAPSNAMRMWDTVTSAECESFPRGHDRSIMDVAFSPDGKSIATASQDGTVKLWDVASRRELFTLRGHEGIIRTCAFSPDGSMLLSGSDDGTLRLWDLREAECLVVLRLDSRIGFIQGGRDVFACGFSPDGLRAVSADASGRLRLWDIERRVQIRSTSWPDEAPLLTCAYSPDGKRVAAGIWRSGEIKVWDSDLQRELVTLHGHSRSVNACAFSPDGSRLVSASSDHTLRVWDVAVTSTDSPAKPPRASIKACAFSPDGRRVVSAAASGAVVVWEADSGRMEHVLAGHRFWVLACAFSDDGSRIFSAAQDETIKIWDAASGAELKSSRGHRNGVLAIAPRSSGVIAWSRDGVAGLYEIGSREPIYTLPALDPIDPICVFSSDGLRIALKTAAPGVVLCEAATGRVLNVLDKEEFRHKAIAFAPDGTRIVTASSGGIHVWDTETAQRLVTLQHLPGHPHACGFSPDARRVVATCSGQAPRLWDAQSGQQIAVLSGHAAFVWKCLFSPAGDWIISSSQDGVVRLWRGGSGEFVHEYFFPAGADGMIALAWRPDGSAFVAGTDDGDVLVEIRNISV